MGLSRVLTIVKGVVEYLYPNAGRPALDQVPPEQGGTFYIADVGG